MNRIGNRLGIGLLAIGILLTGCQRQTIRPPDLGPLAVTCSPQCKKSCLPDIIPGKSGSDGEPLRAWPKWECDNPDDPKCWDEQPVTQTKPIQEIAERCDAARQSCMRCLTGLEDSGVICGVARACQ